MGFCSLGSAKRTDGTTTYSYVYNGSQLTAMTVGTNTLYFSCDAAGTPMSVSYGGEEYYYTSNIQGDVTGIVNDDGETVVTYTYDAWCNILSVSGSDAATLGTMNPLRYRGYVYGQETGLYYLQSRYYNPEIGRVINADCYTTTGQGFTGNNMFVYCGNNPINRVDPTGNSFIRIKEMIRGVVAEIIGSSESTGDARPYKEYACEEENSPNCLGYAMGFSDLVHLGDSLGMDDLNSSLFCNLELVTVFMKTEFRANGFTFRPISGPNGKILECEFRIALRVGTNNDLGEGPDGLIYDYHVMVQTKDGRWAEQHGHCGPTEVHGYGETPDDIIWKYGRYGIAYYDSPILYFAVGK